MKKFFKNNKGFTLVELIIVIAIIAVLTAVAAPQYIKWVEEGRISSDKQMAETLISEVNVALADMGVANESITGGKITVTASACSDTGNVGAYIGSHIDANWNKARVTNKDATKAAAAGIGDTLEITYTTTSVTAAWS